MGWRFRKTVNQGPFRYTITKKGVGSSLGLFGFRIGMTASKDFYFSFGIPGSGLYYIKYFKKGKNSPENTNHRIDDNNDQKNNNQNEEWWRDQLN